MRNFTFLLISGLLCSSISYAQTDQIYTRPSKTAEKSSETKMSRFLKPVSKAADSKSSSIWRPKHEVLYICEPESIEPEWFEIIRAEYTYDERGNIASFDSENLDYEEGERRSRKLTKYNANNMLIERIEQEEKEGELINTTKTEFDYDNIVTDFSTLKVTYEWDEVNNGWKKNYAHYKEITRDANNNITQILVKLLGYDMISLVDTERTVITYDETTGKAKTWTVYTMYEGEEEENIRYDNIVWENTNGQIVETNEQFVIGNNRIKEATIFKGGKEVGTYRASFTGEKDFKCVINYTQTNYDGEEEYVSEEHTYQTLNEKGDFREGFVYRTDLNGDKVFTDDEITDKNYMVYKHDDKGNIIMSAIFFPSEEMEEMGEPATASTPDLITPEEGMEQMDGEMREYTYNEYGEIESQIFYMWFDGYSPVEKYVSSDFYDVTTGLETTLSESGKLTYSVSKDGEMTFSMEGMKGYTIYSINGQAIVNAKASGNTETESITDLPAGLYILKVTGSKGFETVKFLKR